MRAHGCRDGSLRASYPRRAATAVPARSSGSIAAVLGVPVLAEPTAEHTGLHLGGCCGGFRLDGYRADHVAELAEELSGKLLGGGVDEPAAELSELAAHVSPRLVSQDGAIAVLG